MNNYAYLNLKRLKQEKRELIKQINSIDEQISKIEKICDHIYPDGADATETGLLHRDCNICGKS